MITLGHYRPVDGFLTEKDVRSLIAQACPAKDYHGKKILLIVPDGTRTCPLGLLFAGLHAQIGAATAAFDVLIALGTHPPMSEDAICARLEITPEERRTTYGTVRFLSLIHISEPTRLLSISYAVFCLKK